MAQATAPPEAEPKQKSRLTATPTEESWQIRLAAWLIKQDIRFTASANGGYRHPLEAIKLKRMGVSKGFPDIELPYPRKGYHGLYLELKRQKGSKISREQIEWLRFLRGQGYFADIAYSFDEAKTIICNYLSISVLL